ncbi:hypothetical protein Skr01_67130 [Sphaerisporangium krabiense]|nr:hypothetical protein Skr01_67130 [Sphaerisporangium krabiense]
MYVGSLGGLAVLGRWFAAWYRRTPPRPGRWPGVPSKVRRLVVATSTVAMAVGAVVSGGGDAATVGAYDLVRAVTIGGVAGAGAVVACYVVVWHVWRGR